ncbi:hypothetical protein K402DRAFT_197764 [Aulographum hederae CBS 113979]|uniref:Uncharacterized protein n=1 Tax=Aulographum hederae CBS 113979 TaxID=1176131 RepID=A0A6G1GNN7_9PEZI|nr:hypothetical protein K402DRAFT_197764 [Aulographum hederae CBS 113979]
MATNPHRPVNSPTQHGMATNPRQPVHPPARLHDLHGGNPHQPTMTSNTRPRVTEADRRHSTQPDVTGSIRRPASPPPLRRYGSYGSQSRDNGGRGTRRRVSSSHLYQSNSRRSNPVQDTTAGSRPQRSGTPPKLRRSATARTSQIFATSKRHSTTTTQYRVVTPPAMLRTSRSTVQPVASDGTAKSRTTVSPAVAPNRTMTSPRPRLDSYDSDEGGIPEPRKVHFGPGGVFDNPDSDGKQPRRNKERRSGPSRRSESLGSESVGEEARMTAGSFVVFSFFFCCSSVFSVPTTLLSIFFGLSR